jgi:dTDP-glucose 4,6-dehydratase
MRGGSYANIGKLMDNPEFSLVVDDITSGKDLARDVFHVDAVFHLASLASPSKYMKDPITTLRTGSIGTEESLKMARNHRAVMVLASTSEVYGEPKIHPQVESYNGNVDPVGPRSMYDESKRYAEALVKAYGTSAAVEGRIARIFNTYGPRMSLDDGRVVSTFVRQALSGEPLTIEGDGKHTRSFCYVSDLVAGLVRLAERDVGNDPINLGNPTEITVEYLAKKIIMLTGSPSNIVYGQEAPGDPTRRQPDIERAKELLEWRPLVGLDAGLNSTIEWAKEEMKWRT